MNGATVGGEVIDHRWLTAGQPVTGQVEHQYIAVVRQAKGYEFVVQACMVKVAVHQQEVGPRVWLDPGLHSQGERSRADRAQPMSQFSRVIKLEAVELAVVGEIGRGQCALAVYGQGFSQRAQSLRCDTPEPEQERLKKKSTAADPDGSSTSL